MPQHLVKLLNLLHEMIKHLDLIKAISRSLALAYQYHPKKVLETLELWKNVNHSKQPENTTEPPPEHFLATVALTYGEIDYHEKSILTVNQAASYLHNFLKNSEHRLVRLAVLTAICTQLLKNKDFEAHLHEITSKITRYERNYIVERLTEIYLIQRKNLNNSDRRILITERYIAWTKTYFWQPPKIEEEKNDYYPVWLDSSQRPKTAIEKTLFRWIKDDSHPLAQEIATQAFISFALTLDQEEAKRIKEIKKEKTVSLNRTREPVGPIINRRAFYWADLLIPQIITQKDKIYLLSIRHLLPETLKHHKKIQEVMDFVLLQWKNTQDTQLQKISNFLKRAVWWANNLKFFVGGAILLILLGFVVFTSGDKPTVPTTTPFITQGPITKVPQQTIIPLPKPIPKPKAMIDSGINLLIAKEAEVLDIDSANFDGGKLTVQFTENANTNDRLGIRITGTTGGIGVKGKYDEKQEIVYEVFHDNKVIGYFQDDNTEDLEIALTANATKAKTEALVRTLAYQNTSNAPQLGNRKVELQLTDGDGGISNSFSKTISVITENEAPVINVPDYVKTQTIRETQKLSISGISVNDAESQELTVILQVKKGKLTVKQNVPKGLKSKNRLIYSESVVLKGTIEQINTTLADSSAITYQSYFRFNGMDFLQIFVEDSGKKITSDDGLVWPPGAVDFKKAIKTIDINVVPAIILTAPDVKTVDEDTSITLSGINIYAPDSKNATVTLEVGNGTLTIKDDVANGVNRGRIQSNKTAIVTLKSSTIAQINTTLKDATAITYQGAENSTAPDNLKITVIDNGKRTAVKSIKILVNPINDAPEISEKNGRISIKPLPIAESKVAPKIKPVPKKRKTVVVSPTPKITLGKRAKNIADARYKRLSSLSPRKLWKLVCQTMNEVYNREVAKTKTTKRQDKRQIRQKVFNGTVDVIHQDERKKRGGWSRNRIKNKISQCF